MSQAKNKSVVHYTFTTLTTLFISLLHSRNLEINRNIYNIFD